VILYLNEENIVPSFDVVSEVDSQEVTNALDQSRREISTRFDFKNSNASIECQDNVITLSANNDFQIKQILDVVYHKMAKRNVDINSFESNPIETAGMTSRQKINVRQGIDKETAKKIIKTIKDSKLKVQTAIQGEQVRITGKKRDDLQNVIGVLKDNNFDIPLQFLNFRD